LFITKKFLTNCKNRMYFSKEFSFEVIVKISSQSKFVHAASQYKKHGFEKNAFKVLSDIIFIYKQKFIIYFPYSAILAPYSCPSRLRFSSFSFFLEYR